METEYAEGKTGLSLFKKKIDIVSQPNQAYLHLFQDYLWLFKYLLFKQNHKLSTLIT